MIGRLGLAMLAAGYAVTDVTAELRRVANSAGRAEMSIGALPNAILVDDPAVQRARVADMAAGTEYRFDQCQRVGIVAGRAAVGELTPAAVIAELDAVAAMPPRYPAWLVVVGFGAIAAGVSAVFRTTWGALAVDLGVGLVVGVLMVVLGRFPRLTGLLPVALGFASAALVFGASQLLGLPPVPLFAVFAPIVVLVPGATITNAVIELAAGDVVSGGGRLVAGLVTWVMLLLGVMLGGAAVGVTGAELAESLVGPLPLWSALVGLVVMAAGITWTGSASAKLGFVVAVVLLLTFGIVAAVSTLVGYQIASGIAAAIMLVATRLTERRHSELPAIVTFRPAFWLLVPGSLGLASLTQVTTSGVGVTEAFLVPVIGTIVAITLGVQVGAVASEALLRARRDSNPQPAG
ncbi:MAG: threonine/serine exporter family protein [Actinobacteria bacterium]|nr:threonine/serine exporter family protein [Actinomycetota bacterium]